MDQVSDELLRDGTGFSVTRNETVKAASARSSVKYDLLGKVSEATDLLRQTVAEILSGIEPSIFEQYRANPEYFISEAARLIKEQKATGGAGFGVRWGYSGKLEGVGRAARGHRSPRWGEAGFSPPCRGY